jgi:membrane protein
MALNQLKLDSLRKIPRQQIDSFLWQQNLASMPWWRRTLIRSLQIVYAIGRDLSEGQLSLRAMSLVYSTVLGFIPTLALIFAVLKSLGVHNAMEPALNTLLEGLGDRRDEVIAQIIGFVDNIQVGVIGITSMGLLIYLVLEMMRKIEITFNYIWGVSQGRSWSSRVSEYLFAVIVSPLLIFLSISITSSVNTTFFAEYLERLAFGAAVINVFAFLFPLLFMSLAFAFAYSFIPHTRVKFSSAFIGGVVTTIVWKMMGAFFGSILIAAARESIYLAFATVLAVMIFAYVGWLVALLGSDIAYYHQYPNKARSGRKPVSLSIRQQEQLTLSVAALILHRFRNRQSRLSEEEIAARLATNPMTVEPALRFLVSSGLLTRTADEPPCYLPVGSIDDCTLLDIWRNLRSSQAGELDENQDLPEYQQAREFLSRIDSLVVEKLGRQKFIDSA